MREISLDTLADRKDNTKLLLFQKLIDGYIDTPNLLSQLKSKLSLCSKNLQFLFDLTNYGSNHPLDRIMRSVNENTTLLKY